MQGNMRLVLILAVLGLVVAKPRAGRPSYPEDIRCKYAGGRCTTSTCKTAKLNVECGGGDERICCRLRKERLTGKAEPDVASRSARGAEDLDMVNRDPNNIHGSLNVDFHEVLGEPEGVQ
ncbi:PREDICTED: uncharacterized protein LOC109472395 [Branchiostoma belcheri]|uniref:Uncharacterized protein LOC109472395 n=1 Tax=Branchiostoma belcheri TaxID=7741 RepID=A0A6P4Z1A4_BRABE|nr:PREDICTED: uncharacterized protein LOC109472395 [Branchiostoma belcheri]